MELLNDLLRLKIEAAGASAESSDVLATLLRSRIDVQSDGTVKVIDEGGSIRVGGGPHYGNMTIDELVAETAASKPTLFGRSKPAPAEAPQEPQEPPAGETDTAKALRESRVRKAAAAATKAAQPQQNPWARDSVNVTMQVLISAREPERAARLKAEAAALPTYSGRGVAPSGGLNPWAKGQVNITQQVMMQSRDPSRAARLRSEAGVG